MTPTRTSPGLLRCLLAACAIALLAAACQSPTLPRRVLTQEEWRRVQRDLLDEEPVVQIPVDAVFDERLRLIGVDLDPPRARAGEEIEVVLYWEVLQAVDREWILHTAIDGNLDVVNERRTVNGLYPVRDWVVGHRIRDRIRFTVPLGFDGGAARLMVGFRRGEDWMPISRHGDGTRSEDGRLQAASVHVRWFPPVYTVRRATSSIRMDGRLDDMAWRRAATSSDLLLASDGATAPEELESRFRMLWDDDALYVGIEGRDPDIWATFTERDANLWEEEVFELFLDVRGEGSEYLELQINPLGTLFDARFPSPHNRDLEQARQFRFEGIETAVHVEGDPSRRDTEDVRWSAEIRIPFASIPGLEQGPTDGHTVRANVYRYERPADAEPILMAWSPVGGPTFHRPERFGQLVFRDLPSASPRGPGVASTDDEEEEDANE